MTDERPDPPAGYPPAGYPPPAPVPPGYPGTGHPGAGYPPAAYGSAAYGGDPIYPLSTRPSWLRRYLGTVAVIALAALYATVVLATADRWAGTPGQPGVQLTFSTATADGSAPTEDALQQTATTLGRRIADLELPRSDVRVDGTALTVIVPDGSAEAIARVIPTGRLYIRPVVHTYPVTDDSRAPAVQIGSGIDRVELIQQYKKLRQSTNPLTLYLAAQVTAQLCGHDDPLAGNDDPALPLVTCSQDGKTVYVLKPSIISGEDIADASSGLDQQSSQYVVNLKFKGAAVDVWGDFTAANPGTQTAFVLDSQVVSAPAIREAIRGGNTQISGSFTATTAKELANVLKYGSLPLSFEASQAENVSASLGMYALRAGLIAGAVGLALVLLYSLLYYRALGLLVAVSLVASGAMVYAILVLLGRHIGYTLDLAGIAGLIIGIGMTADSFVVFFERIKDEIREGRSFRSAVPRGWARARKTIVSGNAVTFIAAAVLYVLAIGQVKGFAFTLGLTTILDVLVVFLVTWPLVYLASKTQIFAKPAFNGLGALQQVARERRADVATGRR